MTVNSSKLLKILSKNEEEISFILLIFFYKEIFSIALENLVFILFLMNCCLNLKQPFHHWEAIASLIGHFSTMDCKYKWFSLQLSKKQKYNWTNAEDDLLKSLVMSSNFLSYGRIQWEIVAKELNKEIHLSDSFIRLSKHCRERWVNHLDPEMKRDKWSVEEDLILSEKYLETPKKWSLIAKFLKGRTDNSIKNRFNKLFRIEKLNESLYNEDIDENCLIKIKKTLNQIKEVQKNYDNFSSANSDEALIENEKLKNKLMIKKNLDNSQKNKEDFRINYENYDDNTIKLEKRVRNFSLFPNSNEEHKWKFFLKQIEQINIYEKRDYLFLKQ